MTRNTLDVATVPVMRSLSHLPIIIDPSHAAGKRAYVEALGKAGIAAGADGIIVEVHPDPDRALSDGAQSLTFEQFQEMVPRVARVAEAVDRTFSRAPAAAPAASA
jgi:3-deoxy-7-phosphoheptulonate synthase